MKKNNKTIMLIVLIAIFAINAHAQNNNSVSYNEYGTINRIGFEKGYIRSSQEFFNTILNVGDDKTFVKSDTYVDEFGGLHEKSLQLGIERQLRWPLSEIFTQAL